ncbi:MAG: TRAP transporter small permease [Thermoanaerobaculales bacterium]|nr:TRAP transporter small permease [Thermoanaerobaculales bacterium]
MSEGRQGLIPRLLLFLGAVEDAILATILTAMIVLAAVQIVLRNVFGSGIIWADPMLRVSVLWIGMVGAMAATRDDRQISVDALSRFLPKKWTPRLRVVTDIFTSVVAAFLSWHAGRLVLEDRMAGMVAFSSVPVWVCELVLPFAMGIIALRYAAYAVRHLREAFTMGKGPTA